MEDAVCLAESERPQDDRFGLVRASGHAGSLVSRFGGKADARYAFFVVTAMARVTMYTTRWCGYCVRAKALLEEKGVAYDEVRLDEEPHFRQKLFDLTGGWTVPQILIDGDPIGGYTELWRLDRSGQLDARLAA